MLNLKGLKDQLNTLKHSPNFLYNYNLLGTQNEQRPETDPFTSYSYC